MKNLMNLGKTLNKKQQKSINGGGGLCGFIGSPECPKDHICRRHLCVAIPT